MTAAEFVTSIRAITPKGSYQQNRNGSEDFSNIDYTDNNLANGFLGFLVFAVFLILIPN